MRPRVARERIERTYGSTKAEREIHFACQDHLPSPHGAYYRAITVEASASTLFRWLCQLRVAPYSYDWIDNLGRESPRTLTAGLAPLSVGQRFMTIFELVAFEPDRHLTLLTRRLSRLFGAVAVTYLIAAHEQRRCRLIVKVLVRHPGRGIERRLRATLLPWLDLVMMRKQLITLKRLAETQATLQEPRPVPPHLDA
jgi:hypothetical protein